MSRRLLLALLCLIGCVRLMADPVTASQAREKAGQFLNKRVASHARRSAPAAAELKMMAAGKDDSYYIFNVGDDAGFVVVSGEDATEEILGYSDTGSINPDSMPCGMRMLFDNYVEQIKYLRDNGITREQNRAPVRKATSQSFHVDKSRLAKYDQEFPYNKFCPPLNSDNCATGCAATAMAELMFYYQWPSQTTCEIPGYLSEKLDEDKKTVIFSSQIDAIPANTAIDWSNIRKQYNTYYLDLIPHNLWDTDEQADAIATLMKMAGASVHTYYGEESDAYDFNIPYALKRYFGYSSANLYSRSSYTDEDEEWNNKLCNELEKNKPILYFGSSDEKSGGHFFMIEGYQYEDDYYYDINFGYDGRNNDKFLLTVVKGKFKYKYNQSAILDVNPQSTLSPIELPLKLTTDELKAISTDVYKRSPESGKFEHITLGIHVSNLSPIDTKFNYGFMFKNGAIVDDYFSNNWLELKSTYGSGATLSFSCGSNLFDGEYTILAISKEVGSEIWQINDNSENEFVDAWVCNDKLSLKYTGLVSAQLNCNEFKQTSEAALRVGQTSEFGFILTNITSPANYNGGILIKEAESDRVIHIDEVEVSGLGSKGISFSYTPTSPGEHKLMILNKRWDEIGHHTVNVISATTSLDMLEATGLTLKDGDFDRGLIDGTTLSGTLYMKNHDVVTKKANVIIGLEDVEAQTRRTKPVAVNIAPGSTVGYGFSFGNLTAEHHYVITASYASGEEFYRSTELLCTTEGLGEVEPGNEAIIAYEYWFDEDFAGKKTVSTNGNNAVIRASIDARGLSNGVHSFNFRVKRADGKYSAVTSSLFMNLKSDTDEQLEYWLDDDYENRQSVSISHTEEEQDLTLDLGNLEWCPIGFHQLNIRAIDSKYGRTAVNTTGIMKIPLGTATQIEYWFDNDRDNVYTMSGHAAETGGEGYVFAGDLNINNLSPGHHRLHFRGIGSDGQMSTAVGTASIVVKIDTSYGATMASYSISVDGEFIAQGALSALKELDFSYILDTKDLDKGIHILNTTFWNNYGNSVSEDTPFQVTLGDDDAISAPQADDEDDSPIYNLSGIRVNGKAKGVLIKNGKKYVVK